MLLPKPVFVHCWHLFPNDAGGERLVRNCPIRKQMMQFFLEVVLTFKLRESVPLGQSLFLH